MNDDQQQATAFERAQAGSTPMFGLSLRVEGKKRDGKWLIRVTDEYGLAGFSGPKNSPAAGVKSATQSYLNKAKGKLV